MASPDLLVEGLEPGAAYIAAVTSINKKVSWLMAGFQYEESGLASPDLLVGGLEPGAAYIAAVTSINKKVRGLTAGVQYEEYGLASLTCWWRDSNLGPPTLQPSPL